MPRLTEKIVISCDNGPCPTIWKTANPAMGGVQGFKATPEELAEMGLPENETVVFVPWDLLDRYISGRE